MVNNKMIPDIHPFGSFVPKKSRHLILGSFPSKPDRINNWFYGTSRNQFWRIMKTVFNRRLGTISQKQNLLVKLHIAMSDVILCCERCEGTYSDVNLINITYNINLIEEILTENEIEKIFFTSRFTKNLFRKEFKKMIYQYPEVKLITLPSPSPYYVCNIKLSDDILLT
jgi:hypoxanthine-DNA glycosylase